jgi:hypothetical protein
LEKPAELGVYTGELNMIPDTVKELSCLTVYQLNKILQFHIFLMCGTKDELVLRVGMLKAGRPGLAFKKDFDGLMNILTIIRNIIKLEKDLYIHCMRPQHPI